MDIVITASYSIPREDIKSLLDSASRGASYWCTSELAYESETEKALTVEGVKLFNDEGNESRTLNIEDIKKGLKVMAEEQPQHFADFIEGNGDNDTGDVFLQLCLFSDVVYG